VSKRHVVAEGEGISSIAERNGFFPGSLWDHAENAELKKLRGDGNILKPGDVVFVPDLQPRVDPVATGKTHVFRKRGVPAKFRMRLLRDGQPRADEAFTLTVDGREIQGKTDADGRIEADVSPLAREAMLQIGDAEVRRISIGVLEPITEIRGVRQRLRSLGFEWGDGIDADATLRRAVQRFQHRVNLPCTGEVDEPTRKRLEAIHDHAEAFPDLPPLFGEDAQ